MPHLEEKMWLMESKMKDCGDWAGSANEGNAEMEEDGGGYRFREINE